MGLESVGSGSIGDFLENHEVEADVKAGAASFLGHLRGEQALLPGAQPERAIGNPLVVPAGAVLVHFAGQKAADLFAQGSCSGP